MAERKYQLDKTYLQGPKGQIYDYEAVLAKQPGWKPVVPNRSKKAATPVEDEEAAAAAAKEARRVEELRRAQANDDKTQGTEANKTEGTNKQTAAEGQGNKNS